MRLSPFFRQLSPPSPAPAIAREALGCCRGEESGASIAGRAVKLDQVGSCHSAFSETCDAPGPSIDAH